MAAPPTLLALLVLLLNDRVLKQQWPGLVTGKLSDFAGLVVAPPLLALALSVCRVPRPAAWAVGATGIGFAIVKVTAIGAASASAAWSLITPSVVLRDPTDLLALPALLLAWWVSRRSARVTEGSRRAAALALGSLMLPMAVLATAATGACRQHDEVRWVTVVEGIFTGDTEPSRAIVVPTTSGPTRLLDDTGQVVPLADADDRRIEAGYVRVDQACSTSGACWRIDDSAGLTVERSTDGGTTWRHDYVMSSAERADIVDAIGERCGELAEVVTSDLAVLDGPDGPVVAAAFGSGGLLVRRPDGGWRRFPAGSQGLPLATTTSPTSPATGPSPTGPDDPIVPVGQDAPPSDPQDTPSSTPPPCSITTTRVITPDPRNGPETTTQTYCRA